MSSKSPFGDIALKARVADLSSRLAEAEAALNEAAGQETPSPAGTGAKQETSGEKTTLAMERLLLRTLIDIFPDHIYRPRP